LTDRRPTLLVGKVKSGSSSKKSLAFNDLLTAPLEESMTDAQNPNAIEKKTLKKTQQTAKRNTIDESNRDHKP
jgi:hypothetical protein